MTDINQLGGNCCKRPAVQGLVVTRLKRGNVEQQVSGCCRVKTAGPYKDDLISDWREYADYGVFDDDRKCRLENQDDDLFVVEPCACHPLVCTRGVVPQQMLAANE